MPLDILILSFIPSSQDAGPPESFFVSLGLDKNKLAVTKIFLSWLAVIDQADEKEARTEERHRQ
jgi:hypothetical protein